MVAWVPSVANMSWLNYGDIRGHVRLIALYALLSYVAYLMNLVPVLWFWAIVPTETFYLLCTCRRSYVFKSLDSSLGIIHLVVVGFNELDTDIFFFQVGLDRIRWHIINDIEYWFESPCFGILSMFSLNILTTVPSFKSFHTFLLIVLRVLHT